VNAAVVEFNTLADSIGPAAQNHYLAIPGYRHSIRRVVGGKIIRCIFHAADRYGFPGFRYAQRLPLFADRLFLFAQNLCQIFIGKAVFFRLRQQLIGHLFLFILKNSFLQADQVLHLLDEIFFNMGFGGQRLNRSTFAQGLIHDELPFAGGLGEHFHQFIQRFRVEVFNKSQAVTFFLQRPDGFL